MEKKVLKVELSVAAHIIVKMAIVKYAIESYRYSKKAHCKYRHRVI